MNNFIASGQAIGNKFEGIGTIGMEGGTGNPITGFASIISTVIGLLTLISVIYFLFTLASGSIAVMSAGGDKSKYEDSRKKIYIGVIGIAITISAIFLTDFIAWILGIEGILNFGEMINKIAPI